jgi:two-component system sensor kinase FixL
MVVPRYPTERGEREIASRPATAAGIRPTAVAAVALAIFAIDTLTDRAVTVSVLYVTVVLMSASFTRTRSILFVSSGCIALTVLSLLLAPVTSESTAVTNELISIAAIGITTLLTLRNQSAESVLREKANVLEVAHEAIFVRDPNDVITYWSHGSEQLYGWTREEAVGRVWHELLEPIYPAPLEQITAELARADSWEGELVYMRSDGQRVVVESRWSLYRDERHRSVATVHTARDITERRRTEEALRQAQTNLAHVTRVTTLGELTASIAHEVNQPLTAIVNNANACLGLLSNGSRELDEVREALSEIVDDGDRAGAVIARVRSLVRKSPLEKIPLQLSDVVADVLALASSETAARRATICNEVSAGLPIVSGDRVQLQQVLLNLVINGLEAMSTVEDSRRLLTIRGRAGTQEGKRVTTISVRDTGIGLVAEEMGRLFEAFYTTKPLGMGMGLAISRSIIEAHGGRLWAEPNLGQGATFLFSLPAGENTGTPS